MLALQRSIGNRALVQRLAWNTVNGNLAVPVDYASQRIPWDGTYMLDREATEADETFSDLAGRDKPFQKAVQAGLELEWLGEVKAVTKTASDKAAEAFVSKAMKDSTVPGDSAVYSKMVHDAATAIVSHNQVLTVTPGEPLADIAAIRGASRLVRQPRDFLPEAPDLPGVGVDLATKIPSGGDKKYWEYACVLVALYKAEGIAKVREVTGKPKVPDEARRAVQALHDYYVGAGVQYDDGAARNRVMKQWGYGMVFAGQAYWEDLPGQVELPQGTYIFDIKGHTVKVRVLKDIARDTTIKTRKDYFEPDSDPSNYNPGKEFAQPVISIWKKG